MLAMCSPARRFACILPALLSLLAASSATAQVQNPPLAPVLINVFPSRDFVSAQGYSDLDRVTVSVIHPDGTIRSTDPTQPVVPSGGIVEVNHPGGACWFGTTPDIRAGDVVRIDVLSGPGSGRSDATTVANIRCKRPVQISAHTIQVQGTAQDALGNPLPLAGLEARLLSPGDLFDLNGRRTLRAPGDGFIAYDAAGDIHWTATFVNLSQADMDRALAADSRIIQFIGITASTVFENGAAATPGPTPGCLAPLEILPPLPGSELVPPTIPGSFAATVSNFNRVTLTWQPSSDNIGVTSYGVYRDGIVVANVQDPSGSAPAPTGFVDNSVPAGSHVYTVDAADEVGNRSPLTAGITVTTVAQPDANTPAHEPPVLPVSLIAFPSRDFVSNSGFLPDDHVDVLIIRDGKVISSSLNNTPVGDIVEVNHPGGSCWQGATPDLRYGDILRTIARRGDGSIRTADQTHVAGVTCLRAVKIRDDNPATTANEGIIEVHGTAMGQNGERMPLAALEQRIVIPGDRFDLNGRRTIRAGGGQDGTLEYDALGNPLGISWTARYVGLNGNDVARALGGESRVLWLGQNPGLLQEATIYENSDANVPGPSLGCLLPLETIDTVAPTAPTFFTDVPEGLNGRRLSWSASKDDWSVAHYRVFRDGQPIANVPASVLTYLDNPPAGSHDYRVLAYDHASARGPGATGAQQVRNGFGTLYGNASPPSTLDGPPPDVIAPSVPADLAADVNGQDVSLHWSASTDNVGVASYRVYREGANIADVVSPATSYLDADRPSGDHHYRVDAVDAADNRSARSAEVTAHVAPPADLLAPTVPPAVTAAVSPDAFGRDVVVTWGSSTDNVGVAGYSLYRDGMKRADLSATTHSYADSGLALGTDVYTVDAFDGAGNRSAQSAGDTVVIVPDLRTYVVTASAGPNGSVDPAGDTTVGRGADLAITIIPANHYHVADVLADSVSVGAVKSYTFSSVTRNHTLAARFAIDTYAITASAGPNGSVQPAGVTDVPHDAELTVSIIPAEHYHVADVRVDSVSVGAVTSFTFSHVRESHTIAATFAINTHALALQTVGNGAVSRNPELAAYDEMSTVVLTAHPAAGWRFVGWSGDASGDSSSVVVGVTAGRSITATFGDAELPLVNLVAPNGGGVLSAGSVETIGWTATDNLAVTNILLELSTDSGSNWLTIGDGLGNSGSFAWTVPSLPGTRARVRVTARDAAGNSVSDASDTDFEIQSTNVLTRIFAMRADSSNGTGCYPIPGAQGPWRDLGGRYDAELTNFYGTRASGWNGDATAADPERLEFTGSETAAIAAGSVAELQSVAPVTAEVWFRTSHDRPAAAKVECLLEWLQTGKRGMSIALTGGKLVVGLGVWVPTGAVQPDNWYHVAVAKDSAQVRVYLNGARVYTGDNPWNGVQQTPIGIGASVRGLLQERTDDPKSAPRTFNASANKFTDFFTGAIAHVRVWQGAMNDAQALGRFAADRALYPPSAALPAPVRVVSLDAARANGIDAYNTSNITSPWVDLIAPATNANLNAFNGTSRSGWQGNVVAGSPSRLAFDGIDDVVSIPGAAVTELLRAHALSAELWFQTPLTLIGYGMDHHYLMQWLAGIGSPCGMSLAIRNGTLLLDPANTGGQELAKLLPGTWYHVIVAKMPGETRAYLNGARIFTGGSVLYGAPYTAVAIGASTSGGNGVFKDFFKGSVSQVNLWRGAVDDSIAQSAYIGAAPAYISRPAADPAVLSGNSMPVSLALAGPRSNPVQGPMDIHFSLPSSAAAQMEMLDVTGRLVRSVEVGAFGPGHHTVTLGATRDIPAGMYWVRLRQNGRTLTTRAAVIH